GQIYAHRRHESVPVRVFRGPDATMQLLVRHGRAALAEKLGSAAGPDRYSRPGAACREREAERQAPRRVIDRYQDPRHGSPKTAGRPGPPKKPFGDPRPRGR